MSDEKEMCPTCGAAMMEYRQVLNRPLVESLVKIASHNRPINLSILDLTRSAWNNFQKLRYWKLVEKHFEDGKRVGGVWKVTELGRRFVAGEATVSKNAWTYRGEVRRYEGKEIHIWDVDAKFKTRPQWAKEAKPVLQADKLKQEEIW